MSDTPVLVDSESEDEEEQVVDKEEEEDGASVYSDDSDVSDNEELETQGAASLTKPICDKESGKEAAHAQEVTEETGAPAEPRELVWRLAYSGAETSTEIRDLSPATQYQVMMIKCTAVMNLEYYGAIMYQIYCIASMYCTDVL